MWRVTLMLMLAFGILRCSAEKEASCHIGQLTAVEIEDELQVQCAFVQDLNRHRQATTPLTSSLTARVFAVIFPGSPAVNALLATLYISGPPNFLLALCPPNIDTASLSVMVAFAVGGLLGDTLFHLLPEIFLGESTPEHARFVLVEPNKNILLGVAIMVGFVTFVAMDKGLRIATASSDGHGHKYEHKRPSDTGEGLVLSTSVSTARSATSPSDAVKLRKGPSEKSTSAASQDDISKTQTRSSPSIRLSAYLNLIADFTHNITDGLALSSSFYASPTLGATTTMAVFFHEIPHEVGDFALLIQSGFSKKQAMGAQFLTAAGAFLGTCLGIAVQEMGKASSGTVGLDDTRNSGLAGTGLGWGDLLLPFTAGTFLYVATVAVIPDILLVETDGHKTEELMKTLQQFLAMAVGASIMLGLNFLGMITATWTL
ncbi:hypothetical protein MMC26_006193 [Xylographa opegraphella]|nr:hypothetical protein [Xylographa opegraphella]